MSDGEFPFRSFTVRAEGYDRDEIDSYVGELQSEISELRRARDAAAATSLEPDARLHDPEGAVTRTLAIAQETADRVLHDAQVEADRRRAEAEEQAATTVAEAEGRASKMMADIETQTAEVRAQGIAAARAAIQVERDKAVAELGQIRRVRDDIRSEAVELKAVLDRCSRQAVEASEILTTAASGPLMSVDLPDFVSADVALAGVVEEDELADSPSLAAVEDLPGESAAWDQDGGASDAVEALGARSDADDSAGDDGLRWSDEISKSSLAATTDFDATPGTDETVVLHAPATSDESDSQPALADVISIESDVVADDPDDSFFSQAASDEDGLNPAAVAEADSSYGFDEFDHDSEIHDLASSRDDQGDDLASSGAFLTEVRAAADDDDAAVQEGIADPVAADDSFLAELRDVVDQADHDSDLGDSFFDPE